MPDLAQALTGIAAIFATGVSVAAVLSFYRRKPGEKQTEVINVGRATIEIAEGSVNIAKSAAEMQREISEQLERRIEAMIVEHDRRMEFVNRELEKLRQRSDVQDEDLRTVKGNLITAVQQRDTLAEENKRLRERVQALEDRVARSES